jgi:hypothetical protein
MESSGRVRESSGEFRGEFRRGVQGSSGTAPESGQPPAWLGVAAFRWSSEAGRYEKIGDIHDRYLSRRDADLLKPPGGGGLLVPTVVSFRRAVANPGSKGQSDQTSICRIGRRRRRGRFSLGYACRPRNRHSGRIGNQVSQRSPRSARTGKPLDSATKLFVFLFQGNLRGPPQAACDSSTNGWPLRSTANK